jgi:replicative DNA helicase
LSHLVAATPTCVYANTYATVVAQCAIRRQLITLGNRLAGIGYDSNFDASETHNRVQKICESLNAIAESLSTGVKAKEVKRPSGVKRGVDLIEICET